MQYDLHVMSSAGFQIEPYSNCINYDPDITTAESLYCSANKPQLYITANIALW